MLQQSDQQQDSVGQFESLRDKSQHNESPAPQAPPPQLDNLAPKRSSQLQVDSHRQQSSIQLHSPRTIKNSNIPQKSSPKQGIHGQPHLMNPVLDREERDLINLSANLSKEEIWEKLEQKRFQQLKKAAVNLQSELIFNNRCPKCTLVPPCKHYEKVEQVLQEGQQIVQGMKQHLSPKKREGLMKAIKEQQRSHNASLLGVADNTSLNQPAESYRSNNENLLHHQHTRTHGGGSQQREELIQQFTHGESGNIPVAASGAGSAGKEDQSNTFITGGVGSGEVAAGQKQMDPVRFNNGSQVRTVLRNNFNNTVTGNRGAGFRGLSETNPFQYQGDQRSNLSQYGSNILNQQQKRQYLRKREGNGGSPVPLEGSEGSGLIAGPSNMNENRDRTTVRIRSKNNQFIFVEGTFSQPLDGRGGHSGNVTSTNNRNRGAYLNDQSQQSLQERERVQAMIAKYREDKIQRQIERIEQERMMMEFERKLEKDKDDRRKQYNEQLKQKLQDYTAYRQQIDEEKAMQQQMEEQRQRARHHMKRQYMDAQKKYISDYREQKRRTDQLLLIPQQDLSQQPKQQLYYHQFPKKQYMQQDGYYSSGGVVTGAGQQMISGTGQVQKHPQGNIPINQMFQQPGLAQPLIQQQQTSKQVPYLAQQDPPNEGNEEDDYEQYYGEVDQEEMMNQNPQNEFKQKQKQQTSQGVIGMHKDKDAAAAVLTNQNQSNPPVTELQSQNQQPKGKDMGEDSLYLVGHE